MDKRPRLNIKPFKDVDGLIVALETDGEKEFAKYLGTRDRKENFEQDILLKSVGSNTYRRFACKGGKHPSGVFREWANHQIQSETNTIKGIELASQSAFDSWNEKFAAHFKNFWDQRMAESINYGPSRKIPNLLLKRLLLWTDIEHGSGKKLLSFLHVPWDSYTLNAIRLCASEISLPKKPSMKDVDTKEKYESLLNLTRKACKKASVPPIYLDTLAWNKSHPERARQKD